jgi:hypothetical protein
MGRSFADWNPELYPPDDLREEPQLQELEALAREHGWPVDRPWVKPNHATTCCCWRCVPHIVHDTPRIGPVCGGERFEYPCGRPVALSNLQQYVDLTQGATHGQHYGRDRTITCPRCRDR